MQRRAVLGPMLAMGWIAWSGTRAAAAEPLGEADRAAIRSVVQRQLDAFRRDDGDAAFGFASPAIRNLFETPERFMAMVQQSYQPVYRPQAVEFRDIVDFRGQPAQRVQLVGPDGVPVMAYYLMQQQADGSWRINGCVLTGSNETAT